MGSNPTRPAYTHPASFERESEPTIHGSASAQIIKYLVNLENSGYRPETISSHSRILRLLDRNCDLVDPETVRQFIAKRHVSRGRKENIVDVYSKYSKTQGIAFDKPRYSREDTLPFIPLEKEVLAIIDATRNLRHAGLLRLVYETGMRVGEASRLQFRDFDFEKRTVRVIPEKGSRARELKLSERLCAMLKAVFAKYPQRPFPTGEAARHYLENTRKVLAVRDGNPRLLNIHLHTLRHFKATMLYAQTKDILYVQKILGHKWIQNTLRYTQLVDLKESDNFVCKVARTLDEAFGLVEKGFDYVTELDGVKLFRKRK